MRCIIRWRIFKKTLAFARAYAQAGVQVGDINFAEVHDCFTIAELLIYEAMGLKAKGHPVGATGVSVHVMAARQLVGKTDAMQVANPDLGLVFNMGGSGVANYCSILENGGR